MSVLQFSFFYAKKNSFPVDFVPDGLYKDMTSCLDKISRDKGEQMNLNYMYKTGDGVLVRFLMTNACCSIQSTTMSLVNRMSKEAANDDDDDEEEEEETDDEESEEEEEDSKQSVVFFKLIN